MYRINRRRFTKDVSGEALLSAIHFPRGPFAEILFSFRRCRSMNHPTLSNTLRIGSREPSEAGLQWSKNIKSETANKKPQTKGSQSPIEN